MYTLAYDRRIEKDLRAIPKTYRRLILGRLGQLATHPRGPQVEKLVNIEATDCVLARTASSSRSTIALAT